MSTMHRAVTYHATIVDLLFNTFVSTIENVDNANILPENCPVEYGHCNLV